MTPQDSPLARIGGDDLVALREIVVVALLAPAADAAAAFATDIEGPASEVRRATSLLAITGWPGEPPVPVELPAAQAALGRTAVLVALAGAAERAWEASSEALDDGEPFEGREAIIDVVRAGRLLAILSGEDPTDLPPSGPPDSAVLEAFPDGLLVVGPSGRIEWSNHRACELLGESALGMIDSPERYDRWLADRAAELVAAIDAAPGSGGEHLVSLDGPFGGGLPLGVRATDLPNGGRVIVLRPGAIRRPVPRAPRDGEEAFRLLMDTAPAMIWTSDPRGGVTYANASARRMLGVGMEEVLGDRWTDTVHPEDLPGVLAGYRAALDEQRDFEIEFRVERAGGGHAWVISRGTARIDIDRGFLGYVGALHDVTARRRAEEALRCREPERAARPGMMLWVSDAAGRLGFASRDWLAFTGRPLADELAHGWLTSVHPADRHRVGQAVAAAAAEGFELESVHRMRREDGEYRWVRMAGAPRAASDSTRAGLVGHCEDVTARRCDARRDAAVTRLVDLLADGVGLPPFTNALAEEAGALLGAARVEVVMFHSEDAHVVVGAWTRLDAPGDDAPLDAGGAEWSAVVHGDDSSTHDPGRSWGAIRVARAGLLDPTPDERSLLTAFAEILGLAVATAEAHRFETAG